MFGGLVDEGVSARVWQRDPARRDDVDGGWREVTAAFAPGELPPARYAAQLAYDPVREVLVLHGGIANSTGAYLDDTWEYSAGTGMFDGEPVGTWTKAYDGTWTRMVAPHSPPGRRSATLVAEPPSNALVLIGGSVGENVDPFGDVWELEATWSNRTPRFSPAPTLESAGAYSPTDGSLVVVGGASTTLTAASELWTFDGRR